MVSRIAGVDSQTARDFTGFFQSEYPRLVRACLLLTGDVAAAEDLAQDAMTRVYERWGKVSRMRSPDGYLYRTALNLNRKRLRHLAVRSRRSVMERSSPDPLAVAEDRMEALHAVSLLSRPQREALVLVDWLGFDPEEAGRLLGIEAVSVRVRLHRARVALRRRLGGTHA